MHRRYIYKCLNIKYKNLLNCIKYKNMSMQKQVKYSHTYQYKLIYNDDRVVESLMHREGI